MYRFLLTPRWVAGHVLLVVTVITFVNLGFWQLRRLDERREYNALVTQRLETTPVPLADLLQAVGSDVGALEFRRVIAGGRFQPNAQLLTAPRSRDGRPGPQVLTVLESDGPAPLTLVDRGWIPFDRTANRAPPPPDGEVRVEGILRRGEPGSIGTGDQVARIAPAQIGERLGQPLPDYYLELWDQQPPLSAGAPLPGRAPELTEGNHLSYAMQWFSFALIALGGYPILVWRTAREQLRGRGRATAKGTASKGDNQDRTATQRADA